MPVDARHSQYESMVPKWQRMRDAVEGEDAVKAKGKAYLPVPPGIDQPWGENDPAYLNYLRRAPYPDIVAPTIQGMVGLMSRKETQIEMPTGLDRMREQATPDGLDVHGLLTRTRFEVLTTGRYVLFVDAPEDGGEPFIATYSAESLINWRSDGDRVTMAVFEESVTEPKADDPFVDESVTQWREASIEQALDENNRPTGSERYVVRVWRAIEGSDGSKQFYVLSEVMPQGRGVPMDRVPVVIVGSRHLLPDPDQIPMLGVANRTFDYYRQVADYRLALFMSSQVTPYGTGLEKEEIPTKLGPSAFFAANSESATFGFLEISGNGLNAQKESLQDTYGHILDAAMRVIGDGKRSAESGEALRLRFQSQTATLSSVAQSTAEGVSEALRMVAEWDGIASDGIQVVPDTSFIRETPDAQVLTVIADLVERGLTPDTVLSRYAARTDLTEMDDDEFRNQSPALAAQIEGDEPVDG